MADGVDAVAMEVSSPCPRRCTGSTVPASRWPCFTNLSRDHLDFHPRWRRYFQAKARLFDPTAATQAVVNLDDPRGRLLRDAAAGPDRRLRARRRHRPASCRAGGTHVPLAGRTPCSLPLAGPAQRVQRPGRRHRGGALGVDPTRIAAGLAAAARSSRALRARRRRASGFAVVVDYAHTPDALERCCCGRRGSCGRRRRRRACSCVFGCGGDRDATKRAPMGAVAAELADVAVAHHRTTPQRGPRGDHRRASTFAGASPRAADVIVELDRRAAIALALAGPRAGDVVVIAGKGHETTQTVGDRVIAFDDRVVAARAARGRRRGTAGPVRGR